jgi:hypothetical protein
MAIPAADSISRTLRFRMLGCVIEAGARATIGRAQNEKCTAWLAKRSDLQEAGQRTFKGSKPRL